MCAGLFVSAGRGPEFKVITVSTCEIDVTARETLHSAGEMIFGENYHVYVGVFADANMDPGLIVTAPYRCVLSLRRVTGLGT